MFCLRIPGAYCVLSISKMDFQVLHGLKQVVNRNKDILVHQLGIGPLVFLCVAPAMYNSHLLNESTLPTLPCTCGGTWNFLAVRHNAFDGYCVATWKVSCERSLKLYHWHYRESYVILSLKPSYFEALFGRIVSTKWLYLCSMREHIVCFANSIVVSKVW